MYAENGLNRGGNQYRMSMLGANQPIGEPRPFTTNTGLGNKFSSMLGNQNLSSN